MPQSLKLTGREGKRHIRNLKVCDQLILNLQVEKEGVLLEASGYM